MPYPAATSADIEFFREHGWLRVDDAVDPADLEFLGQRCDAVIADKERRAYDWAWSADDGATRSFRILQAMPTAGTEAFDRAPFRLWAVEFASALMGFPIEHWYDQLLAKPASISVPTDWHQDEAYWGRNLDDRGITCWMPLHDVDVDSGCMHFIDGGHRDGVLEHHRPAHLQSDLLVCAPDIDRSVACPVRLGGVTFHHSKTPHMTTANTSVPWRMVLTQHLREVGNPGEGGHYPWKVWVEQFSGRVSRPDDAR